MNSSIKIHFWYVAGILIGLLILVMTDRWTDKANFTVFLSNAATLTSLVLGVVAIFYSIMANADLSKSLGNISRVSEEVVATRSAMGDFIRESQSLVASGKSNAEALQAASSTVGKDIGHLEEVLETLRTESQQLRESVVPIPTRIDELAAKISGVMPQPAPVYPAKEQPSVTSNIDKESLLRRTSLVGIAALYGLALAHRRKQPFDCMAISEKVGFEASYLHGFAVALHSLGALHIKPVDGKPRSFEITKVAPAIVEFDIDEARSFIEGKKIDSKELWLQHLDTMTATIPEQAE